MVIMKSPFWFVSSERIATLGRLSGISMVFIWVGFAFRYGLQVVVS